MGKMSRDKGARFEREVAALFKEWGYDAHRTAQYRGNTGQAGDVEGVPYIHIEAKHCERMTLYDWMEQAQRDARAEGKNNLPVVIHRQNGKPALCTMTFDAWIQLYNEYQAGKSIRQERRIYDH